MSPVGKSIHLRAPSSRVQIGWKSSCFPTRYFDFFCGFSDLCRDSALFVTTACMAAMSSCEQQLQRKTLTTLTLPPPPQETYHPPVIEKWQKLNKMKARRVQYKCMAPNFCEGAYSLEEEAFLSTSPHKSDGQKK